VKNTEEKQIKEIKEYLTKKFTPEYIEQSIKYKLTPREIDELSIVDYEELTLEDLEFTIKEELYRMRLEKQKALEAKKKISGQALVETIIVLMVLIPVIFATIQLTLIAYGKMAANDAAMSAVRCAVVQADTGSAKSKASWAGLYVLETQTAGTKNIIPGSLEINEVLPANKQFRDSDNNCITMYKIKQNYFQHIVFSSILNPFMGMGISLLDNSAGAYMVRSPDPEYLKKAYNNANDW